MLYCETTGIEPYYALTTIKRFADGGEVRRTSRAIVDGLVALGHTTSSIATLSEYALDHGHLADAPGLRDEQRRVFQTAAGPGALSPTAHLRMVAAVQPLLSGGVSRTVPLPTDTDGDAIEDIFIAAWRLGLKAIAVYRERSRIAQPLTADED